MEIGLYCPACRKSARLDTEALETRDSTCPRCGHVAPVEVSPSMRDEGSFDRCALCGQDRFFKQKSFNRVFGIGVVLVAIAFAPFTSPPYISLFIGAAIDGVVYLLVPWVGICYNCETEYRGLPGIAQLEPFEHLVAQRVQARRARETDEQKRSRSEA
ncbi:MAG: hypothetical protein CME06_11725 [Gemmatimonadetes bacterium]|nr:hypothetical protein [Gemmatimonadota bacterium]